MRYAQLRAAFAAVLVAGGLAACSRPAQSGSVIGPQLGESTAPGPADPTMPPPDAGVAEVSVRLHDVPTAVPNPAPTVQTMPPTTAPMNQPSTHPSVPATVWAPGVPSVPGSRGPSPQGSSPAGASQGPSPGPGAPPAPGAPSPTGPATGPTPVPPIPTAPPPQGTPPLAPPNGPGGAAPRAGSGSR